MRPVIIFWAFFGIAAEALSWNQVKTKFETFELQQDDLKNATYYYAYQERGLFTFANIVKNNTFLRSPHHYYEIDKEKYKLNLLSENATTDNNDELARIADRIEEMNLNYLTIIDEVNLSNSLKLRALIMAVQFPRWENSAKYLERLVNTAITAEQSINLENISLEKAYEDLYNIEAQHFFPPSLYMKCQMEIINGYYRTANISEKNAEKIQKALREYKMGEIVLWENFPIDSKTRVTNLLNALPSLLKSETDLWAVLKDARITCNFVRCRSTEFVLPVVTRDDVKKEYEIFELNQRSINYDFFLSRYNKGWRNIAQMQSNTRYPYVERLKDRLYARRAGATIDNDDYLADIADLLQVYRLRFDILYDIMALFEYLKLRVFIRTYEDEGNYNDLVTNVVKAELANSTIVDLDYKYGKLIDYSSRFIRVEYTLVYTQNRMKLVEAYLKRPEIGLSEETIANITLRLTLFADASDDVQRQLPIDSIRKISQLKYMLPPYVKHNSILLEQLKSAEIECNFVRCKSTKKFVDHITTTTRRPYNSAENLTSGLILAILCTLLCFFLI